MTNPFAAPAPQQPVAPAPDSPFSLPQAPPPAPYAPPAAPRQPTASAPPAAFGQLPGSLAPPPPGGDGAGAKVADMYGRLVLFFPQYLEENLPSQFKDPKTGQLRMQSRMTAVAVVLDDGQGGQQPIAYGGDPTKFPPVPHTASEPLPYVRKGLFIWQNSIIAQLRDYLPGGAGVQPGTAGMQLGRVSKDGPERTDPWYLKDATEQDRQLAQYYLDAVGRGQFPHPLAG